MSTPALLLTLLLLALLAWRAWYWFVRRRRVRPLAGQQKAMLEKQVAFYRRLSKADKARFEEGISRFLEEVTITGVETEVTEADRLLVAASAVIPLFGFPGWRYRNLNEVLFYPDNTAEPQNSKCKRRLGWGGSYRAA